jgi:GH43 family beta-xylosidase
VDGIEIESEWLGRRGRERMSKREKEDEARGRGREKGLAVTKENRYIYFNYSVAYK